MSLVVLDPGHGGTSPSGSSTPFGESGPLGVREKELTLQVARRLAGALGGTVVLTRDSDHNASLRDRIEVARRAGAAAFVSLHASSAPDSVWVHDRAEARSHELGHALADALSAGSVQRGRLAVLDPGSHDPGTGACLVELDLFRHAAEPVDVERTVAALARGLRGYVGTFGFRRPAPTTTLFDGGRWTFPAKEGTVLLWYGGNEPASDTSHEQVARTLGKSFSKAKSDGHLGPLLDLRVVRAFDKQGLLDEFARCDDGSVIQVHYVGHGDGGGLYCAYGDVAARAKRLTVKDELARRSLSGVGAESLREYVLEQEPTLATGLFDFARWRDPVAQKLHPQGFFQLWGCFSGSELAPLSDDGYWNYFKTSPSGTPGVARHIAKALGIRVIASDTSGSAGNEFWFRRSGTVRTDDRSARIFRPSGIPQWLWPHAQAEWVTREPTTGVVVHRETGGTPATAFTDMDPRDTRAGQTWVP